MARKITIQEFGDNKPDYKNPIMSKDKVISNWFINWIKTNLELKNIDVGDILPHKKEIAYFFNTSIGTIQNALRYVQKMGYLRTKQCVGTFISTPDLKETFEQRFSKTDLAICKIKKILSDTKLETVLPSTKKISSMINIPQDTVRVAMNILADNGILKKTEHKGVKNGWILVKTVTHDAKETPDETISLHYRISEKIKKYIKDNCKAGDKIPPYEDFALMFKVSIRTINQAIKLLRDEGILLVRRGSYGTLYIRNQKERAGKTIFLTKPKDEDKNNFLYNKEKAVIELKKYILKNFDEGDKLPTLKELVNILNLKKGGLRHAVKILNEQNILYTQRGRWGGIFVNSMPDKETDTYAWLALNPGYFKK